MKPLLPEREEALSGESHTALTHPCSWGSPRARRSPGSPSPPERTPYTYRISMGVRASRVRLSEEDNLILKYKMRHYVHITRHCPLSPLPYSTPLQALPEEKMRHYGHTLHITHHTRMPATHGTAHPPTCPPSTHPGTA